MYFPPHLMQASGPSSRKLFVFLPCIWHRSVLGLPPIKKCNFSFYFVFLTHRLSFLFTAPYADLWTTVHKMISFLACIWHISAPELALTSHVVKFIHRNTHTCSPDLCLRATSVCVPLSHRLAGLCHDISHACTSMFESLLLYPYCVDDLWTSVHHPDKGHRLCHWNRLTTLEFCLSSFLTP